MLYFKKGNEKGEARLVLKSGSLPGGPMPHAGLMDERLLGNVRGPLQRAKLHLRAGKRRISQKKIAAGIATLYDAFSAAMEYYIERALPRQLLRVNTGENLNNERDKYSVLVRSGVLDGTFDFAEFDRLTEKALHEDLKEFDSGPLIAGIDSVMLQLGVLPFDESTLPPEDPQTF